MNTAIRLFVAMFLAANLYSLPCAAQDRTMDEASARALKQRQSNESYGATFGRKVGSGFSNMALGWIELPKNVLNTTNDVDTKYALFGVVGGVIKGVLHTVGRTMTGVGDLMTAPLPTKSMIRSDYVWDDFKSDTNYGPYFQLRDSSNHAQ